MTPLPKRRHSTHRQGKRRQNLKIKISPLQACPNCGQPSRPHRACPNCGTYKGRSVLTLKNVPPTK